MTVLTHAAETRLDDYLARVRQALDAHPDVSPDEVAADVREHIETEFAQLNRPVTVSELDAVLARLGPPNQWASAATDFRAAPVGLAPFDWIEAVRGLRRRALGVIDTLWKGPEDWRLPYLAFGLILLAPVTMGVSLLLAYFLGRATVELAEEKGQPLGARRWLDYPAIVTVNLALFLALMFFPAIAAGSIASGEFRDAERLERAGWRDYQLKPIPDADRAYHEQLLAFVRQLPVVLSNHREVLFVVFALVGVLAAWWMLLGLAMWAFPKWPPVVFHPLLDGYDWLHGRRLALFGGVAFAIWAGYAYRLWAISG